MAIMHASFGEGWFIGFGMTMGQILGFFIDFCHRHYNTHTVVQVCDGWYQKFPPWLSTIKITMVTGSTNCYVLVCVFSGAKVLTVVCIFGCFIASAGWQKSMSLGFCCCFFNNRLEFKSESLPTN